MSDNNNIPPVNNSGNVPPPGLNGTKPINNSRREQPAWVQQEQADFTPGAKLPAQEIILSLFAKRTTVFLLMALLVVFLLQIAEALPPFVWAIVTAYVLNRPMSMLVRRTGWPRWSWVAIFYLVFFGSIALALVLIVPNISREALQLTQDAPKIKANVDDYLNNNETVNIVGFNLSTDTVSSAINSAIDSVTNQAKSIAPKALTVTFRLLIDFLLYLVVTFYLLLGGGATIFHAVTGLPLHFREEMRNLLLRIDRVLTAYIRGQFILIAIMTVASFIILTVLGVNYAFVLAITTGILELIPYIGPYLAMTIAGAVAYFQPHGNFGLQGLVLTAIVVVCYFIVRQIEDYVVVPAIIGKIVELPGILVIFAVLAGATLLGPMGLLLAVPIVATIKIIVGYLFYKLVDAEREKVDLRHGSSIEELTQILASKPDNSRVLIEVDSSADYLKDPQNLDRLKQLEHQKQVDIAIDTGDEKLGHLLRQHGFPIVTLSQEHFLSNRGR